MKKLLPYLLAAVLLSPLGFIGCQALQDFEENHPIAYDAIKGTAKIVLLSQVPEITDNSAGQTALRGVIETAFAQAAAPEDVAIALADGVATVYPDDESLQNMIAQEWAAALRSGSTVPASAPGARDYQLELADALSPPVSGVDYEFDPAFAVTLGREL